MCLNTCTKQFLTHRTTLLTKPRKYILYIKSGNATIVLWHCALSAFALCKHCSGNSALVSPFFFFFKLPFCLSFAWQLQCQAALQLQQLHFFQSSVCFFFLIYCCTDTTNFTIFSQLLKSQFLISQNKIINMKL